MASEIFQDFPESPTKWVSNTRRWFHPRSDELKVLDTNLDTLGRVRSAYQTSVSRLNDSNVFSPVDIAEPHRLFMDVVSAHGAVEKAFRAVEQSHENWGDGHESRNRKGALDALGASIEQGNKAIQEGKDRLREATHELVTPSVFHLVWNGSEPREDVIRKARILELVHPDHQINIWADKDNLLANDFRRETAKLRENVADFNTATDPALDARIERWKNDPDLSQGLDVKLTGEAWAREKLPQRRAALGNMQAVFAGQSSRIKIRDVGECWDEGRKFPENEGALSIPERRELKAAYQFEVGQRCNFGASTDIAREVILHDEPGKYLDYDKTPAVKGFSRLVDAYNTSLDGLLRTKLAENGKPDNSPVKEPPDLEGMHRRWKTLHDTFRDNSVPRPIDIARWGSNVLNAEGYQHLINATREHIDQFVPKIDGTTAGKKYDNYQALLEHVRQFDSSGRVQTAFKEWEGGVHSVQDGYERLPPVGVSKLMFKMLELAPERGAVINSAMATSTPGARGLTLLIRSKIEGIPEMRAPDNKRAYMDDSARGRAGYIGITVLTTGPGSLTNNPELLKSLRDRCGASGRGSELMKIPFTQFPNPSTSELDTSWTHSKEQLKEHSATWGSIVGTAPITDFSSIPKNLMKVLETTGIRTPAQSQVREQLPQRRADGPSRRSESLDSEGQPKRGRALSR